MVIHGGERLLLDVSGPGETSLWDKVALRHLS